VNDRSALREGIEGEVRLVMSGMAGQYSQIQCEQVSRCPADLYQIFADDEISMAKNSPM
jgi:hypothetical protein